MSARNAPPVRADSRPLSVHEVRTLLSAAEFSYVRMRRHASGLGDYGRGDTNDLLHDAIMAALDQRACLSEVSIEKALFEIMRSKRSTAARSRARSKARAEFMPLDEVAVAGHRYTVLAADQILEVERIRTLCADVLERLSTDPELAALIEAIADDLRGQALADRLGLSRRDLASLRRALKRKIQKIWPDIVPILSDGMIVDSPWSA